MKRSTLTRRTELKRGEKGLKRTEMKRSAKRMPRRSAKKAATDRVRREVLERCVEERGPQCEACASIGMAQISEALVGPPPLFSQHHARLIAGCEGLAMDGHEILTRGRGGSPTDPANILLCCRKGHDWIGAHPKEAHRIGLLKHSWETDA